MKDLIVGISIAVVASVGLSTAAAYFVTRSNLTSSTRECADSAEITTNGKSSCEFAGQKIEVWPITNESWIAGAKVLVKCICPRDGVK